MRHIVCLIGIAFLGSLLLTSPARAQAVLSNLPGTPAGSGTNLGLGTDGFDRTKGVGLTTSTDALEFISMVALISNTSPASTLSGGIFSNTGTNNPGTQLASFVPVPVPANTPPTEITLTTASPFTLDPNTTYWFLLDGPTTTNSLLWQSLSPNTAPTASGVTFVGYRFSSNGGTAWASSTIFNGMTINAVIPEPASLSLLAGAGMLLLRWRK